MQLHPVARAVIAQLSRLIAHHRHHRPIDVAQHERHRRRVTPAVRHQFSLHLIDRLVRVEAYLEKTRLEIAVRHAQANRRRRRSLCVRFRGDVRAKRGEIGAHRARGARRRLARDAE